MKKNIFENLLHKTKHLNHFVKILIDNSFCGIKTPLTRFQNKIQKKYNYLFSIEQNKLAGQNKNEGFYGKFFIVFM